MVEWFGPFLMAQNWDQLGRVFNVVMNTLFHEKVDKFMNSFAQMSSWRNALVKELRWVDSKAAFMTGKAKFEVFTANLLCQVPLDITNSTEHLNLSARRI